MAALILYENKEKALGSKNYTILFIDYLLWYYWLYMSQSLDYRL